MCGINGFTWEDSELIRRMNEKTAHRGPDGTGAIAEEGVSLGHNRLAIIDVNPRSAQPMESFDRRLVIVFNGEVYNYRELKKELSDYPYKSESDTEVILAAYQKWGKDAVKKLNGIFAFAIWNRERRELFLARDHVGIKPLYCSKTPKGYIFSSELKAMLEHAIPRKLSVDAFTRYLRVGYVPHPQTMIEGVWMLPPGSYAYVRNGTYESTTYWRGSSKEKNNEGNAVRHEHIRELIDGAVKRQLVSDRPLGVFLSGGIDSTIVLDAMSRTQKNIDTFTIGFDLEGGEEVEKFNADAVLAKRTAEHYGAHHHEYRFEATEVPDLFLKTAWHMDEPVANATALVQYALAGKARERVAVALGGDGGDELFGGYPRYMFSRRASMYQRFPYFLRSFVEMGYPKFKKLNTPVGISQFSAFMFQKDPSLFLVVKDEHINTVAEEYFGHYLKENSASDFLDTFMDVDRETWLPDESLHRTDRMAMAHGLEVRVPLLDIDVVTYARSIPSHEKVSLFDTKIILKDAYRRRIPEWIINAPKRGWFSPAAKWLRRPEVQTFAREVLSQHYYAGTSNLFKWEGIEKMLNDHIEKKQYNLTMLWTLLAFQTWAKEYKVGL